MIPSCESMFVLKVRSRIHCGPKHDMLAQIHFMHKPSTGQKGTVFMTVGQMFLVIIVLVVLLLRFTPLKV